MDGSAGIFLCHGPRGLWVEHFPCWLKFRTTSVYFGHVWVEPLLFLPRTLGIRNNNAPHTKYSDNIDYHNYNYDDGDDDDGYIYRKEERKRKNLNKIKMEKKIK